MLLTELNELPQGLLSAKPTELQQILPHPTLIHLPGQIPEPIYFSVMLHGNEPTGLLAVQQLLQKYQHHRLPRSVSIFFGNTAAAQAEVRRLPHQPDYNRIWPGTEYPLSLETEMAVAIVDIMRQRNVFASIDIHNNTGVNPHYACINSLHQPFVQLASMFSHLIVYFLRPKGVQSAAFAELCPAVTLECGRPGQKFGVEHALDFLDTCLHLRHIPSKPLIKENLNLYHTVAQVTVNPEIRFSFSDPDCDLLLTDELELMNFTELPRGTILGKVNNGVCKPLLAKDEQGQDATEKFFSINGNDLIINRHSMPSMFTLNELNIKQDCLCYLMEKVEL